MNRRTMVQSTLLASSVLVTGRQRSFAAPGTPVATPISDLEARLDAVLTGYNGNKGFSGAVLIAIDGKPVLRKGYSMADPMKQIVNTPETGYQIASITKTFTASLIMQLRDEGKLTLDDPASNYLADYPNLERDGVAVTIKQLLSHTAGVVDFLSLFDLENPGSFPSDLPALIDVIKKQPLAFTPGSEFLYSNSGYLYLGQIITSITGNSWGAELDQRLLKPLGLTHTWFTAPEDPGPQAIGFLMVSSFLVPISQFGRTDLAEAAGGLTSTVDDLLMWDQALYAGKVISRETLTEMIAPLPIGDGLGFEHAVLGGFDAVGHFGQTIGYRTAYMRIKALNATIIILSNHQDVDTVHLSDDLAHELTQ